MSALRAHPDHGGSKELMQALNAAKDQLETIAKDVLVNHNTFVYEAGLAKNCQCMTQPTTLIIYSLS